MCHISHGEFLLVLLQPDKQTKSSIGLEIQYHDIRHLVIIVILTTQNTKNQITCTRHQNIIVARVGTHTSLNPFMAVSFQGIPHYAVQVLLYIKPLGYYNM